MNAITRNDRLAGPMLTFELNGRAVSAHAHETLIEIASREGVDIPHLCYKAGMDAVGNCRSCMVEIDGERVLAPSCCRYPAEGMKVHSMSARAVAAQKMVLELLLSDMPETAYTRHNEVDQWAAKLNLHKPRFQARERSPVPQDATHAAITVNLDACIQCTRCVRACRDEQVNDVIGLAFRGDQAKIVFDMDDAMGNSTCVGCGECVQACPTGALMPARSVGLIAPDQRVDSVCPYCGVGCQLTYNVKDNKILFVEGRDGPAKSDCMFSRPSDQSPVVTSIDWPSASVTIAFLMSTRRPMMPRKRLVLPLVTRVLTLRTLTLNRLSTAAAISSLVDVPATRKTTLFCSDRIVAFSVMIGDRMVS